jgi:hypothetical protein
MLGAVGLVAQNVLHTGAAGAVDEHRRFEIGGEVVAIALIIQREDGEELGIDRAELRVGDGFGFIGRGDIEAEQGRIGHQECDGGLGGALQQQEGGILNIRQAGKAKLGTVPEAKQPLGKIDEAVGAQLHFAKTGFEGERGITLVGIGVELVLHAGALLLGLRPVKCGGLVYLPRALVAEAWGGLGHARTLLVGLA